MFDALVFPSSLTSFFSQSPSLALFGFSLAEISSQ